MEKNILDLSKNGNMKRKNIISILDDIRNGKPVIVVDDEDREFEGDLVIAAEKANYHNLTFLSKHGGGLMCIPCFQDVLTRLDIPMMRTNNLDKFGTPFTVSVDSIYGKTGVSIEDRLKTLIPFIDKTGKSSDLSQPGHMFPLRARPGLLKERRGHTESSIELMLASKMIPVSIIIEIMNPDGTMTKGKQLIDYSKIYNLNMVSIEEIYSHVYKN